MYTLKYSTSWIGNYKNDCYTNHKSTCWFLFPYFWVHVQIQLHNIKIIIIIA